MISFGGKRGCSRVGEGSMFIKFRCWEITGLCWRVERRVVRVATSNGWFSNWTHLTFECLTDWGEFQPLQETHYILQVRPSPLDMQRKQLSSSGQKGKCSWLINMLWVPGRMAKGRPTDNRIRRSWTDYCLKWLPWKCGRVWECSAGGHEVLF